MHPFKNFQNDSNLVICREDLEEEIGAKMKLLLKNILNAFFKSTLSVISIFGYLNMNFLFFQFLATEINLRKI